MENLTRSCFTLFVVASALVSGCVDDGFDPSEGDDDAIELRGGATIRLRSGTDLDLDELESRESYGATLTDDQEVPWFVRVEGLDDELLDSLGLEEGEVNGAMVHFGVALDEDSGEECLVFVPFSAEAAVMLSRPAGDVGCPEELGDVEGWIPEVQPSLGASLRAAFGTVVGTFNGITAYSNGSTSYNSGSYSTCGLKWQCVEYVNRYYYQKLAHKNLKGTGNANAYYSTAASKGLVAYANGGSVKPQVGDMIVSGGGTYGHIAIIRAVGASSINVIHQNWSNSSADDSKSLSMTVSGGKYTVAGFSGSYAVTGWLRRTGCTPTVSSVTPTSAQLNKTTSFTVAGSCLPTTTTAWVGDCANLTVTSAGSSQVKFTCTPSYSKGTKSGLVKQGSDGTTLKSFSVSIY